MARGAMTKSEIEEFFRRLAAAQPAPETELEYANPYTLLVAVVLSAQATDVGVNKATKPLFARVDTPKKMLALGEERLIGYIKSIGLYRTKARNVMKLSAILVERQDAARRRACPREARARQIQAARPSLAYPARPLCLQGAQARLPDLRRQ